MTVQRRNVIYDGPGGNFATVMAWDDAVTGPRPGVLVLPNVLGQKEADNLVADALAARGYVGFVADVYGAGKRTTRESDDPAVYMKALNADRALLRRRLEVSLIAMSGEIEVDPRATAAVGFCFGGKCALDMARAGLPIRAAISFHGLFDPPGWEVVTPIKPKVLVCHGWADPLATPDAVVALAAELDAAGADWELHGYGGVGHGFTDQHLPAGLRPGFGYDEDATRRGWASAYALLEDVFGS